MQRKVAFQRQNSEKYFLTRVPTLLFPIYNIVNQRRERKTSFIHLALVE